MKRLIICAILVLALSTQAYGWGHRGGDAPRESAVYNGGSSAAGGNRPSGVTAQDSNNPGNPVSVPEPATLLLLGAGLGVIIGFRKKLKKG